MSRERFRLSSEYGQLRNKIFFNTILMFFMGILIIGFLYRFIFFGRFANAFVAFLERWVFTGRGDAYEAALSWYQFHVRNYLSLYYLIALVAVFAVIFRVYLNSFTKYFNEIQRAVDGLLEEGGEVSLLPELSAMEKKIRFVKETLERRKTEAELAEKRKNDLIVYLAHDLKTPLTSVIGYLHLLQDEPQLSDELRARYTGIAMEKAERLEELINEFFDITRFNLTTLTLEPERTNLSRMLEQVVSEFEPVLREKELTWKVSIQPDVWMLCDRDKLERVFDNLIRNAVNYSYEKSEIRLTMKSASGEMECVVSNRGKTIPEDKLERIFDQFFRLDLSRSSATGGAGIGLAIAKEIAELHGGSIRAESADERVTFVLRLPAADE